MIKKRNELSTAKVTGLLYLGIAITGIISFALIRAKIYANGDSAQTLNNLISKEMLSRIGITAELALVIFQALTGLWFFKLFKKTNAFTAISLAVFGLINATAILIASAFWLSAQVAANSGESASTVYNLFVVHEQIWVVSALFFGLWLIPMGQLAKAAKMPKALSAVLIYGGIFYIVSTFISVLFPEQTKINDFITIPATIGEFWIIGYLLFKKPTLLK